MSNHKESVPEAFIIKDFILRSLTYKYFYIASFVLCLTVAFMINKFSSTVYEVNSIIGPVEDNRRSSLLGSNDFFSGLGVLSQSRNLENDLTSLNSFTLVYKTLNLLNL